MSGLAGLGAIAGGFANGVIQAEGLKDRADARAWNKDMQTRQRDQWKRDDALQADLDAARQRAKDVLGGSDTGAGLAGAQPQPGPQTIPGDSMDAALAPAAPHATAAPALDMGDRTGVDPATAGMSPQPSAAQPRGGLSQTAQPSARPDAHRILLAQEAFTDELLRRGRTDMALDHWVKGEQQRVAMRAPAAQTARAALAAGGDVTSALQGFDNTMDTPYEVVQANAVRGLDGKTTVQMQRRNRLTGKVEDVSAPAETILDTIDAAVANPAELAKHTWQMKVEAFKADKDSALQRQRDVAALERTTATVAGANARNERTNDTRETVADTGAKARVTVAGLRKQLSGGGGSGRDLSKETQKVMNNAAGEVVAIMKDGSPKVIRNDDGSPMMGEAGVRTALRLLGEIAKSPEGIGRSTQQNLEAARRAAGTIAPATKPASTGKDFSNLWK